MKNLKKDKQLYKLLQSELQRQKNGLEMIASENYTSPAVLEAMGTVLSNKYSEGYPGKRYYSGNQFIDEIENLAIERAKKLFGAEHANVQPHSGSQANMAVYLAILNPGDKIMALNLAHGGHLSHGAPVNFSGKLYKNTFYGVDKDTEQINYKEILELAQREAPKLIIAGATAYPRQIDFQKFREIADSIKAYLMVDMAHFAGLVAAKVHPDPIPYADVVTSTTHKTLAGPRGGFILCKKYLAEKIDKAVFPGIQGGPLENIIAAKAICFGEALKPTFKTYQKQVIANAKILAQTLIQNKLELVSKGTDTHLVLLKLNNLSIGGQLAEEVLARVGIYTNKNLIPFDTRKALDPSGLRLGTPALTTRGMKEKEMKIIGNLIAEILKNPKDTKIQEKAKKLVAKLTKKFPIYKNLKY
ncbi:serine hydroxymethyltransferase [Candidatus Falkowbacteria bacterium]|nr:serine hydroxymethyltransferase [Candidatus Falkowbacteria bacterium]